MLFCLVFVLRHALEATYGAYAAKNPGELCVSLHHALEKEVAFLRVEAAGQVVDGFSAATPLGIAKVAETSTVEFPWSFEDMVIGFIPGSIGETSVIAIAIGAIILLVTNIASWKTMFSVFVGGALMALIFNVAGPDTATAQMPWYEHLALGGFAFGAVFMATDPVTSARTETGKYIYGLLVGAMAIIIRVLNPGYPEGMMLAILLMNVFAPLIDYYVVEANIKQRLSRVKLNK